MLRLGLFLLCVPAIALMVGFMYENNSVQDCLVQGGSWDYINAVCDTENRHPFVPFMVRHPLFVNGGMLLSVVGLLMTIVGLYKPSRVNR